MKRPKFPENICVRRDRDDKTLLLIVGTPEEVHHLDAKDGDAIATYTLNGPVRIFRHHSRLEK